ncbi:hypothetical protein N4G69_40615, partial [Streptomyces mirabilis]|nr:hypothetical protein [Streptomyces mirabilis]
MDGWEVYEDDPKTDPGARTIALDSDTVQALMRHRAQQDEDREEWEACSQRLISPSLKPQPGSHRAPAPPP